MSEYVEIDAQELNDYISNLEDENEALKAQVEQLKITGKVLRGCNEQTFCDLKTDEEKSAFFLSGRGYETGIIAVAIQNDVAMAYHRCAEYKKELAELQAEYAESLKAVNGRCLAEIKAQAVEDAMLYFSAKADKSGESAYYAQQYANQLRQQAKGE